MFINLYLRDHQHKNLFEILRGFTHFYFFNRTISCNYCASSKLQLLKARLYVHLLMILCPSKNLCFVYLVTRKEIRVFSNSNTEGMLSEKDCNNHITRNKV